ncbi:MULTISPECIES: peptidylprolyl isomerase [Delftia]|jgi:peptidyl-prolyl cis-trans isomerase C|uniref:peptidylprolyl isomerase n=1 Tax=Delftia acidovorans TaxID=80866 RepID=A0AAJ2QVR6_DELAC|nr:MULTISPECIES: peptidylprolyl isomerase [Delftia]MDX4952416.1 peptidylprolyl isomerase [Delftia acidovorans]
MKVSIRRFGAIPLALVASMAVQGVHSAELADAGGKSAQVLAKGNGITITLQDLEVEAQRIPPEVRPMILSRVDNVKRMASDLYIFRSMAQMAQQQGWDRKPEVVAALQAARDKVLSDAWLDELDAKNMPSIEAAQKQARSVYLAQPQRFQTDEQVRARHILIAGKGAEARAQAEQILEELKKGADFSSLAKERSADKGSAARGGDLGFFSHGRMVPEFDKAAFALQKTGDLSGVVESQFGLHIIRLEERRPPGVKPFEEVRDELVKEIRASAAKDARVSAADKIRQDVVVDEGAAEAFAAKNSPKP